MIASASHPAARPATVPATPSTAATRRSRLTGELLRGGSQHRFAKALLGRVRREIGGDDAPSENQDAVAKRTELVEIGAHDQDCLSVARGPLAPFLEGGGARDVDSARRLREDEGGDPRRSRQRPLHDDLLLVSARERTGRCVEIGGSDPCSIPAGRRFDLEAAALDDAERAERPELSEDEVVPDARVERQAFDGAILMNDRDTGGREHARVERIEPREHANQLALAVAVDAGAPPDLAGADGERRRAKARRPSRFAQREPHLADVPPGAPRARRATRAHDVSGELVEGRLAPVRYRASRHETPVSEHAHVVRVLPHFVESMRDDDHGAARVGELAQRRIESVGFPAGQRCRRLIEDDDAGLAHERSTDLEPLLVADPEGLDARVPGDGGADVSRDHFRPRAGPLAIEATEPADRLRAEHDVVERRESAGKREVLLDHAYGPVNRAAARRL